MSKEEAAKSFLLFAALFVAAMVVAFLSWAIRPAHPMNRPEMDLAAHVTK